MSTKRWSYPIGKNARSAVVLRNLVIVLSLVTVTVVVALIQNYYRARKSISAVVITQLTETAESKLNAFFTPIVQHALIIKKWGQSGVLNLENDAELNAKFIPILEQLPQIHSVLIASDEALNYALLRGVDFWNVRLGKQESAGGGPVRWKRLDPSATVTETWTDEKRVNPLSLAWYVGATSGLKGDIHWTEPHQMFASADAGITAAVSWQTNGRNFVAALNLLLRDIVNLMAEIRLGDTFKCFVYSGGRPLIDLTATETAPRATAQTAKTLGINIPDDPVLAAALDAPERTLKPGQSFSFQLNGLTWWAHLIDFEDSVTRNGLGIVVPEEELVAKVHIERYLFVLAALAIFWIGLLVYARATHRERKAAAERIDLRRVDSDKLLTWIENGEGAGVEFKSTLRWNLNTDKAGKEIELAALKTVAAYLNSEGGILLVGVKDSGEILGIDADRFENDDKCLQHFNNIFNQHIGIEFSSYVDTAILTVRDRRVLVVACRRSPQPVFVKNKKDELLFVRSGPSSRQLSSREVLEYLKDRSHL